MTDAEREQVERVAREDREAAWHFRPACYTDSDRDFWLEGTYDGAAVIRAFALHRTAAITAMQPAIDAAVARAVEAERGRAAKVAETPPLFRGGIREFCHTIAAAIRKMPT